MFGGIQQHAGTSSNQVFNHFTTTTPSANESVIKTEASQSDLINNNSSLTLNNNNLGDEKRPDFYDDMFS